jgi:hypothetical protein
MDKPKVNVQGKVIIEYSEGDFLLMFPDGRIEVRGNWKAAKRCAQLMFKREAVDAINVGFIEWRNLPEAILKQVNATGAIAPKE